MEPMTINTGQMFDMLCNDIASTKRRVDAYTTLLNEDLEHYIRKILISDLDVVKKKLARLDAQYNAREHR